MQASLPKVDGDDLLEASAVDLDSESDAGFDLEGLNSEDEESDGGEEKELVDKDENVDEEVSALESESEGSDQFSLAEASDADDLMDLDAEIPDGLIEYDGSDVSSVDEESGWHGLPKSAAPKRKAGEPVKQDRKRRKLRSLPTFVDYDTYAKMIEDAQEDDV
jgi:ribosome biogenesis protein MAK21